MARKALDGKPYAGNPHVRIDEGDGASARPRRSSLLYKLGVCGLMAFGVVVIACAAVQNVTITDDNAFAYNAENRLVCDSGSKILVKHSYRADGTTLKAALLDFIDVTQPAEGQEDPWVSIRLLGAGLTNDVDFSEQPYLWLGTTEANTSVKLDGTYEPYGDVYKFGYSQNANGEYRGLVVTNLTDNPLTGAPRSVLAAGSGNVPLGGGTYTGGVVAEGPAYVSVGGAANFGTGYKTATVPAITLRNVKGQPARLQLKNSNLTYPEDLEIRIEGTNVIHSCGASSTVITTLKGPITGWGQINLTDQGGVRFSSASNTFTGVLNDVNAHGNYTVEICIGDGANCSWVGSQIIQPSQTNHILTVHCDSDFTLNTALSANGGRVVKKGVGTLTLGQPFTRTPVSARPEKPVLQILGGTVKRTQTEPAAASGVVEVAAGATLDLNQIPATSLWLPIGGGSIINSAGGAVTFTASGTSDQTFYGSVAGRATVKNPPLTSWSVGSAASFDGGLDIASGQVRVVDGFMSPEMAIGGSGTLLVAPHEGSDEGGLKMECWWSGGSWTGDGHAGKMTTALAYIDAHEAAPNFSGDMSAWGETFYSGTADTEGGGAKGAFAKSMGSTRDQFVARFTGYFIAEQTGVYAFRGAGDDGVRIVLDGTNQIVNVAAGSHSTWGTNENVPLTAGRHPITIYFLEEGGWEILYVQMKAPGETAWSYVPTRLLSTWDGRHADLGTVMGAGALGLAAAGVAWPTMDLTDFSGRLLANDTTATADVGAVTPVNSYLYFQGATDFSEKNWWRYGNVAEVVQDGRIALDMGGVKESNNYMNRLKPLDLSKPFTVSFDFSIHEPWANVDSLGDGFCCMLNNSPTSGYGGTFSYSTTGNRIGNSNAYGIQCYMMPPQSHYAWIKNNVQLGAVTTNTAYAMRDAKDRTKPFHVTFAWDLEKLTCTFEQEGKSPLTFTNANAKNDILEKFPSGQAYLGLWARNGGYYCTMLFENLVIEEGDETPETETVTLDGVLGITNGTAQVVVPTGVSPVLASDLQVVGAGGISSTVDAALTGDLWSFDLRNPEAKLALTGAFTFPNTTPITVSITGEATPQPRVLADLSGVEGTAADALRFQLDETAPVTLQLVYSGRCLSVFQSVGTVIFIK